MAQTGFTPLLIYSSSTATNAPTAGNLLNNATGSELAINIADGKLFYKDSSNAVQVIGWKIRPATAGGTGLTSFAVGDLIYADTTTTLNKLVDVATGNALISGGVGVAPSYGKIGLTTHVSGTLPVGNGGTGITTTPTNGQIPIGNGTNYTAATLTAGSGISIANASGSVTVTNTQNTGPAFSAYANANQSISNATFTKIQFQTKEFDTNSNFDSTTNYRFTPTVAGYYFISGTINFNGTLATSQNLISIYKNGSEFKRGGQVLTNAANNATGITVTALIQFNGSTDYVEIYGLQTNGISVTTNATLTYFQGFMARTT